MSRCRAGVLGRPVAHSLSPVLHAAAYRELGMEVEYVRHDLGVAELDRFVRGHLTAPPRGEDWLGVSVTMPLKAAVVAHADTLSDRVRVLGVANTLVRDHPDHPGAVHAHNTDVDGIVRALADGGLDPAARGGTVGVLGNGGTAAAAVAAADLLGADAVLLGVREPSRAEGVRTLAESFGLGAEVVAQAELVRRARGLRAVVATLPPRGADALVPHVPTAAGASTGGAPLPPLLDAAYAPWPSALANAWAAAGGEVVSGLAMLLHQGIEQVRLFTERPRRAAVAPEPDWAALTRAAARALGLPAR